MFKECNRLPLKALLFTKNPQLRDQLRRMTPKLVEIPASHPLQESIKTALAENSLWPEDCLFLAGSREEIEAAQDFLMAVAGYRDKEGGDPLWGVPVVFDGLDGIEETLLVRTFERRHGIPWKIAETKRCIIREFAMEDLSDLIELYDQPGISYRINDRGERIRGYVEPLYPLEEEWDYQKSYIENMYHCFGYGMWLVIEKASGKLIGRAGLENREYDEGVELELGYLIHPKWQQKGIAFEVCQRIIAYAAETFACEKMNILLEEDNTPSVRLAKRLGFFRCGEMKIGDTMLQRYVLHLIGK